MNNKKSMAFNEFLGLVLALTLLFVFIIYPGSKLYSAYSKQQYTNSYNNLVATIENIADSELNEDSTDLIMEDDTAIVIFKKNADEIKIDYAGAFPYFLKRMNECEKEKACICLCKKTQDLEKGEKKCEGICKTLDGDFINWLNPRQLGIGNIGELERYKDIANIEEFKAVEGGFFYSRRDFPKSPQAKIIYIEEYNDFISICFDKPCINDEQKSELEK